jgi:heme A synthase
VPPVSPASTAYRRIALATVTATFLLIVVGGIVRVSDSGLGCGPGGSGLHGWPLCRGDVLPGTDINAIVEYIHRTAASVVGLLWLGLAVVAWRRPRYRPLRWVTTAGFGLVVAQGLLGAIVVDKDLEEGLVAGHLGLAMLLFALSIYLLRAVRAPAGGRAPLQVPGGFKALAFSAQSVLLGAIVAGGYMAGSEKEGLGEWAKTRAEFGPGHYEGAHYACGHQFPTCNDAFLPFGNKFVNIHLTHRVFVYLTTILVIALVVAVLRRRPSATMVKAAWVALGLLGLQIVLGGLNVWLTDEYSALVVAHLTVATLLWATLTTMNTELVRAPALEAGTDRPLRRAEADAVAV